MERSYYRLETMQVYLDAEQLGDEVWQLAFAKDFFVRDTIGKQLARSADSVSANIAEGYAHFYFNESKRYYGYARASIQETRSWIQKMKRRQLCEATLCDRLDTRYLSLLAQLTKYIQFVEKGKKTQKKWNQKDENPTCPHEPMNP